MNLIEMVKLGVSGFKPSEIKKINESGIATDDIISLAKSGYSAEDVNELITMASQQAGSVQLGDKGQTEPSGPEDPPGNDSEKQAEYIEKINAQEMELAKLKKTLEAVQTQNASKNLGGAEPKDPRKEVQEIFKTIY